MSNTVFASIKVIFWKCLSRKFVHTKESDRFISTISLRIDLNLSQSSLISKTFVVSSKLNKIILL